MVVARVPSSLLALIALGLTLGACSDGGTPPASLADAGASGADASAADAAAADAADAPDAATTAATCTRPATCTADVTGRWRLVAACEVSNDEQGDPSCGATVQGVAARFGGEWAFDGAELHATAHHDIDFTADYPPACAVDDCVAAGARQGWACSVTAAAHCLCHATKERDFPQRSGRYTLAGLRLTVTSSDTDTRYDVCVSGDVLHVVGERGEPVLGFERAP